MRKLESRIFWDNHKDRKTVVDPCYGCITVECLVTYPNILIVFKIFDCPWNFRQNYITVRCGPRDWKSASAALIISSTVFNLTLCSIIAQTTSSSYRTYLELQGASDVKNRLTQWHTLTGNEAVHRSCPRKETQLLWLPVGWPGKTKIHLSVRQLLRKLCPACKRCWLIPMFVNGIKWSFEILLF